MTDVEKVKEAVDIIEIIRESAELKKSGSNFKALCPFHSEKTPSFYVSPERQVWHCFGCGRGGDVYTFLMERENLEFPEALRLLANRAGVKLSGRYESTAQQKLKERLYEIHHLMSQYYHYLLFNHKVGEKARQYLKERKISDKVAKTFKLGYAPNSWRAQLLFLTKKGYQEKEIKLAGLAVSGKHGLYDRFRARLMFPLRDHRGQTIGFSGRLLEPQAKEAKYINSPETPIYKKANNLFGLDITNQAIKKEGKAIVVEGEFDLLASYQAGVSNVVAIKGSALTDQQLRLLKRFTDKIIFALDSDLAGDEAARRAIAAADNAGFSMEVVELPQGKDPDECIRQGISLWKKAVSNAVPIYDYLIDSSIKRYDVKTAEGKKRISNEVISFLANITNPIVQGHYIRKLASVLDVSEETVMLALEKIGKKKTSDQPEQWLGNWQEGVSREERLEEIILALIFQQEEQKIIEYLFKEIDETDFNLPVMARLFVKAKRMFSRKQTLPLSQHFKTIEKELATAYNRLILLPLLEFFPSLELKDIAEVVRQFKQVAVRRKIKKITTKIKNIEEENWEKKKKNERLKKLNSQLAVLTKELKSLS